MATKRINVLVYAGTGSSLESVRHCIYSLRRLLSPTYAVLEVTGDTLIKEPWTQACALLVFPGGGDLGYCKTLNGAGNRRIRRYVHAGGSYIGFCAGGYYGSARCEFEVDDEDLEVVGPRELQFFPGTCRGSAFKGFKYGSEIGTRAAEIKVNRKAFGSSGILPQLFKVYFNGGSVFVDAQTLKSRGIEVLANYTEELDVDGGAGSAAVVYCKAGEGTAILTGPHPEFASANLSKHAKDMDPAVVDALEADDGSRAAFFKSCLIKLGLTVNQEEVTLPTLSMLHLSSKDPSQIKKVTSSWSTALTSIDGDQYIKAEQDSFLVQEQDSPWSMSELTRAALDILPDKSASTPIKDMANRVTDYSEVIKTLIPHISSLPTSKDTPFFSHDTYFNALQVYCDAFSPSISTVPLGTPLLYGEVVTSTSTLLEKNTKLTSTLPSGTTFTATTQLSARGRGSNVWLSPAGSLMFSTVLRHPLTLNATAPVVFVQYLAALAVAEALRAYAPGPHARLPVRLKWPNDVYARDPRTGAFTKVGGILVSSSYAGGDYTLVVGVGLNVANAQPTVALDAVLAALAADEGVPGEPFALERLLACILAKFAELYALFCRRGFAGELEEMYYRHWLHAEQVVTLETEGGVRAKIKGITTDWGLLRAVEVVGEGREMRETGREFALQTDSNSFDFFKGLVKRKI
ncbi:hypothetical protein FH972_021808 [Carpinus fangiana]|uniref:BPL/LPL catalytic domain-containing protein n=1 Tax=Carpinus fangiana TaxID=176857 RepID=A0A5N6KR19_9ROSI|nr:hypothetical protein FH972_021808 [Carpinus fangiana]